MSDAKIVKLIQRNSYRPFANTADIIQEIDKVKNNGKLLKDETINIFFMTLMKNPYINPYNQFRLVSIFPFLFSKWSPNTTCITKLLYYKSYPKLLADSFKILKDRKVVFPSNIIDLSLNSNQFETALLFIQNIDNNTSISSIVNKLYSNRYNFSYIYEKIFKVYIQRKKLISYNDINTMLTKFNQEQYCLQLFNIIGNNIDILNSLHSRNIGFVSEFIRKFEIKLTTDQVIISLLKYNTYSHSILDELMNQIYKYGYIPDKKLILAGIEMFYKIPNVEKYVEIDNDIINKCIEYNFIKYDIPIKKIPIDVLYKLIQKNDLNSMKLLLNRGMKLNIKCLELACENTHIEIINYLIETFNMKLNKKCYEYLMFSSKLYQITKYAIPGPLSILKETMLSNIPSNINKKHNKQLNFDINVTDEIQIDNKQPTITIPTDNKQPNITIPTDNKQPTHKENKQLEYNILEIDEYDIEAVLNRPYKVTKKMIKFFTIKKGTVLAFSEVRNMFIQYVVNKKLICKENTQLIKVNKHLNNILKLKEKFYFNINDIDNVVCMFYL